MSNMFAQSKGIGTTWIAGTMNRDAFEAATRLEEGERMPCVTPLGRPAARMALRESLMRKGVKADSRQRSAAEDRRSGHGLPRRDGIHRQRATAIESKKDPKRVFFFYRRENST